MLTQVYEISTAEEASAISAIGVDHVGVLVGDGQFPRELPVSAASNIGAAIAPPSKFSAMFLTSNISLIASWVRELKPSIVHLGASAELVSPKDVALLKQMLPGIVVDLNFAPKEMFANLFRVLGVGSDEAEDYADRVIGWRTAPKADALDGEAALYRAAGLPYAPKGSPFASPEELWRVPGLPRELVVRALDFVTVFNGRREVDVFAAVPEVIASLPGIGSAQMASFMAQRETLPRVPAAAIDLLGTADGTIAVYSGDNVRLNCSVAFDKGWRKSAEIIIQLEGGEEPYRVLSWRDLDEIAPRVGQE